MRGLLSAPSHIQWFAPAWQRQWECKGRDVAGEGVDDCAHGMWGRVINEAPVTGPKLCGPV